MVYLGEESFTACLLTPAESKSEKLIWLPGQVVNSYLSICKLFGDFLGGQPNLIRSVLN